VAGRPGRSAFAGASQVTESQTCAGGKANVTFSWQGSDPASSQQWLDLTTVDNGWQAGTFIGAGPLGGRETSYTWNGLLSNTLHYIRVNQQLRGGAWDGSGTFPFTTVDCGTSTPATSGGLGASYTLLGFSDHTSSGSVPPDVIAPGGSLQSCNPLNLYAFVRIDNLTSPKDYFVTWFTNAVPLPRGQVTVLTSSSITLSVPHDTDTSPRTTISIRLNSSITAAAELEGSFTLKC
jgi:hypothetical protein